MVRTNTYGRVERSAFLSLSNLVFWDSVMLIVATAITWRSLPAINDSAVFFTVLVAFSLAFLAISRRRSSRVLEQGVSDLTLGAPAMGAIAALVLLALTRSPYSGSALLIYVILSTGFMAGIRLLRQHRAPRMKVLFIGASDAYVELRKHPRFEVAQLDAPPATVRGWDVITIDPSEACSSEWLQWLDHVGMVGGRVVSASRLMEASTGRVMPDALQERWVDDVFNGDNHYAFWKRMSDVLAVAVLSPLLVPLVGILAILVLLDSGKPIFFVQERVGRGGVPFRMVKFRTMRSDAEAAGAAFATAGDHRVTKLGKVMRKLRLDELPQFWNVLRGDMSVLGPRPEQRPFAEQFSKEIPLYDLRHNVRPGISGWAQVEQGYADSADTTRRKLSYDLYYIKNLSLALDFKIVAKTIRTMLTGFGAR